MPYALNQGVRINYEVEGDGPALLLLHGTTHRIENNDGRAKCSNKPNSLQ